MEIKVPYGSGHLTFSVDEERVLGVYAPNDVPLQDESGLLQQALANPCCGPSFARFMEETKELLVLVNDGTRPTPTAQILEELVGFFEQKTVKFMVATGTHRPPTQEEYRRIFGQYYDRFAHDILVHDSKQDEMTFLGTSRYGTEMALNTEALKFPRMLIIGSVEPHYFAGYTGGRKALLPGIAAYKTIEQNHEHAMNPAAAPLALKDNPVHEDMVDALRVLDTSALFSIQTVLDRHRRIYGVTAGDIHQSFEEAILLAHEVYCVDVDEKADVIVAAAPPPMDLNLYQSQKAIENNRRLLKHNGIFILVSACHKGIGGNSFYPLLSNAETPEEVLDIVSRGYKLGYHKAANFVSLMDVAELWTVTELEPEVLESIFLTPMSDLQSAVDEALRQKGPKARVLVFPEGSVTVPRLRGGDEGGA